MSRGVILDGFSLTGPVKFGRAVNVEIWLFYVFTLIETLFAFELAYGLRFLDDCSNGVFSELLFI
jgi:hypothetical protein